MSRRAWGGERNYRGVVPVQGEDPFAAEGYTTPAVASSWRSGRSRTTGVRQPHVYVMPSSQIVDTDVEVRAQSSHGSEGRRPRGSNNQVSVDRPKEKR